MKILVVQTSLLYDGSEYFIHVATKQFIEKLNSQGHEVQISGSIIYASNPGSNMECINSKFVCGFQKHFNGILSIASYCLSFFKSFKYINKNYLGDDFPYIIHMLLKGKFKNIGEGNLILSKSGMSNRSNIFEKYQESYIDLVLPFNKLFKNSLILSDSIKLKYLIFIKILKFNFDANILRFKWLILKIIR